MVAFRVESGREYRFGAVVDAGDLHRADRSRFNHPEKTRSVGIVPGRHVGIESHQAGVGGYLARDATEFFEFFVGGRHAAIQWLSLWLPSSSYA